MITSIVGALLSFFGIVHLKYQSIRDLELVHHIAQYAHCSSQGKIGSGFDVSAAVYGSHRYKRFSPGVLEECLNDGSLLFDVCSKRYFILSS